MRMTYHQRFGSGSQSVEKAIWFREIAFLLTQVREDLGT